MQWPEQWLTNHRLGRLSNPWLGWGRAGETGEKEGRSPRTWFFKGREGPEQVSAPLRTSATIRVKTRYTCYLSHELYISAPEAWILVPSPSDLNRFSLYELSLLWTEECCWRRESSILPSTVASKRTGWPRAYPKLRSWLIRVKQITFQRNSDLLGQSGFGPPSLAMPLGQKRPKYRRPAHMLLSDPKHTVNSRCSTSSVGPQWGGRGMTPSHKGQTLDLSVSLCPRLTN